MTISLSLRTRSHGGSSGKGTPKEVDEKIILDSASFFPEVSYEQPLRTVRPRNLSKSRRWLSILRGGDNGKTPEVDPSPRASENAQGIRLLERGCTCILSLFSSDFHPVVMALGNAARVGSLGGDPKGVARKHALVAIPGHSPCQGAGGTSQVLLDPRQITWPLDDLHPAQQLSWLEVDG